LERSSRNEKVPSKSTRSPGMECMPSKMPDLGASLAAASSAEGACGAPVGGEDQKEKRWLQLHWILPRWSRGLRWTSGGGGLRWKAGKGPAQSSAHIASAPIDHRVSVVLPDDGERRAF
jgi:hypothetical protein